MNCAETVQRPLSETEIQASQGDALCIQGSHRVIALCQQYGGRPDKVVYHRSGRMCPPMMGGGFGNKVTNLALPSSMLFFFGLYHGPRGLPTGNPGTGKAEGP